jgi:aspartate/methionine/tyrosine aminotransferase
MPHETIHRPITPSLRSAVAPFLAMDVLSAAGALERAGRHIVHMEVGEPGAPTPRLAREAAARALEAGRIGYTEALGRASLRERIARHYREAYGVEVAASRIAVTTGSSAGFLFAFLALFEAGARVAVAEPGYPAYRNIFQALGIETVGLVASAATGWRVTAAMIESAHQQKPLDGVLLMSPANPTGTMMDAAALRDICETCDRLGIAFISDEIYHGLTYSMAAETALRFSQRAVIVNSFSKYYCMTGWRIGWLALPENLVRPVERLQQSFAISAPFLSQVAAEAAFDAREELEAVKAGYVRNRALLLDALPSLGLGEFPPPDGAFYVYADVGRFTNDSLDFAARMLNEAGVAATPGVDFDPARGGRYLRFSFAGAETEMVEALKRLRNWLR